MLFFVKINQFPSLYLVCQHIHLFSSTCPPSQLYSLSSYNLSKQCLKCSPCFVIGWLFKIELSNVDEMSELMTEEKYNEFLKQAE